MGGVPLAPRRICFLFHVISVWVENQNRASLELVDEKTFRKGGHSGETGGAGHRRGTWGRLPRRRHLQVSVRPVRFLSGLVGRCTALRECPGVT